MTSGSRPSCDRRTACLAAGALLALLPGATTGAAQRLGLADTDSAGTVCLDVQGSLAEGTRVWLVQADTPQSLAEAEPAPGQCRPRRPDPDVRERRVPLRVVGGVLDSARLSIAIVGARTRPAVLRGIVRLDLDGDGTPERFRACTSQEGIHLTIWSGRPLTGRLRWHRYYYLGYDVEPSCTAADGRDPAPGAALGGPGPSSG